MPAEIEELLQAAQEKRRAAKKRSKPIPTRRAREGEAPAEPTNDQYLQKQALLAEPLSLDDLLRDDLDEGPLGRASSEPADEAGQAPRGGVIDYEGDDVEQPPRPPRPREKEGRDKQSRKKHWHAKRGRGGDRREELESRPRESFGKKRGGKRVFSPQEQGRGAAGEKGGSFRFRPKHKKRKIKSDRFKSHAADNQRRGERRGKKQGKQVGQGRKGKGRR
jgi:hypothetical protein